MALRLSAQLRSARPAAATLAPQRLAATALPLSLPLAALNQQRRAFSISQEDRRRSKDCQTGHTVGEEVLALNKALLGTISRMDFPAYALYMSDDISCFEPEAAHQQVVGKDFHKYFSGNTCHMPSESI